MKIDISSIIAGHWRTLYDNRSQNIALSDVAIFYFVPIAAGATSYYFGLKVEPDNYNVSITFFGIFLALLLNIQVAIFAVFQRKWDTSEASKENNLRAKALQERRKLLTELNTNISYLTVVSCAALVCFLVFFVSKLTSGIPPAISVVFYTHFLLTFLMIVKRSHALFHKEYRDSPS